MTTAKKGDIYWCPICGVATFVDADSGPANTRLICCGMRMEKMDTLGSEMRNRPAKHGLVQVTAGKTGQTR